jgi:hypothetical protein
MGKNAHREGRSAKTGRFMPVKEAQKKPNTSVVENVPNPGHGDTKK